MNFLYPLKFKPIFKEKIWGGNKIQTLLGKDFLPLSNCGESWEISGVEGEQSVVNAGNLEENELNELIEVYMGDLVGDAIYEKHGLEFPLLIKFIDSTDWLSIQVHPNDELAKSRHDGNGKSEMWYVLHAEPNAEIIVGFNREMNKETYLKHLKNKTLRDILNVEKVKTGDVFYIPAGRIHAIGPGICLAEIQQTSDFTYRIYDWNRVAENGKSRELHTDLALDAIDFTHYMQFKTTYLLEKNKVVNLVKCPYFTTNLVHLDLSIMLDYTDIDSFVIYICLAGSMSIVSSTSPVALAKGECVLLPASINKVTIVPEKESKFLEVYIV